MSVEVSKPGDRKSEEKTKFLFADGETVLCYHGPLLYEAKVNIPIFLQLSIYDLLMWLHFHSA